MPARTVALLGATGTLGANLLTALAAAHAAGNLRLVVLHRASSDVSAVPAGVEKRVLDPGSASEGEIHSALSGVEVLVVSTPGTAAGEPFLRALSTLTPALTAYIPSWFTANWTAAEEVDPAKQYIVSKAALRNKAVELGLPVTTIRNGLFEDSFFGGFGVNAVDNTLHLYGKALESTFSFSSLPYIGAAVAQIVTLDKLEAKYTVAEAEFTGAELAAALQTKHGKAPAVSEYTDADVAAAVARGPGPGLGAGWRTHWGNGNWTAPNRFAPEGVVPRTLAQGIDKAIEQGLGKDAAW
ncbi:hypothetical protein Q8F55_008366 [Vanrija albida]|uniref:NmrA-like domain-containing protein n=1 Tax=Vanrija albida TaxID=181172 RepID=A0ABR3PW56_9TREE